MLYKVREKNSLNNKELHVLKQSGELYKWKEEYKQENLKNYYYISKKI